MATLNLKSERQIQIEMLATLISELSLNDVNPGSVNDILTQAAAQSDFGLYYQIAQVARLSDINALTGNDLDLKAFEVGITRLEAQKATGVVNILRPEGFEKVSTSFFAGSTNAISGQTTINVSDASNALFSTSGTLILGRGTNNEEEVSYTSAPVNNTNFWTFTLSTPLANDHGVEETVILKQGNDEEILAGTVVIVPATSTTEEIQFELVNDVTLLSGESSVNDVEVVALNEGESGNVSALAINGTSSFASPPFNGARVQNLSKFTTGRDRENDEELRDRIKSAGDSLTKGVTSAVRNAIVGLVDPESAKRVVSASVVLPVVSGGTVKVYIDDGTGFEPSFSSSSYEVIRSNSTGGEQRLQLDNFPLLKASSETLNAEPFNMSSGVLELNIQAAQLQETIQFNLDNFTNPETATAEEIASVINDRSNLLEARTSDNGSKIVITSKSDTNETIQVLGGSANSILGFQTDLKETLNLYVDDVKLSKDGSAAILESGNEGPYNLQAIGAFPLTMDVIVDGKTANTQTVTFNLADAVDPSSVTTQEIVDVLNRDLVGIEARTVSSATKVVLESGKGLSSDSKLEVLAGGTLNDATNGINFSTTEVTGSNADYVLNKELGIIELTNPLAINQLVTAGSLNTRANLVSVLSENYSPALGETLVINFDGGVTETVTFDGTFASGLSALNTANFINASIKNGKASVKRVGTENFLQITTNSYSTSGSISISSASTANTAFQFQTDTTVNSSAPNKAFIVSGNSGSYALPKDSNLVLILDQDQVNSTFSVTLSQSSDVTASSSSSNFTVGAYNNLFQNANELVGYGVGFSSGANTSTGSVDNVVDAGSGVFTYNFASIPVDFTNIAIGDFVNFSGMGDPENDGNFIVTAKGVQSINVSNVNGVSAINQSGSAVMSQRRVISAYNSLTGEITTSIAFSNTPSVSDEAFVVPSRVDNLVDYLSNTRITSLSLKADIEKAEVNKLQISSKELASDGSVQITGGSANLTLGFSTNLIKGITSYSYYSGLLDLVHRTIYGDDTDTVSFPGVGASGVVFEVLAPTVKDLTIDVNVTLNEGITIASVSNEIKSAVSGYVNALGVGEDVVLERIRSQVIAISGIRDVSLSNPLENVAIADNELARISNTDISVG